VKRIDLGDIGNVAETIAAIAVIISLIYLGVQINQNTNAIRASSYQSVADNITDFQLGLAQNSDLTRIYLEGLEDLAQRYAAIGSGMRCSLSSGQLRGEKFAPLYLPA